MQNSRTGDIEAGNVTYRNEAQGQIENGNDSEDQDVVAQLSCSYCFVDRCCIEQLGYILRQQEGGSL